MFEAVFQCLWCFGSMLKPYLIRTNHLKTWKITISGQKLPFQIADIQKFKNELGHEDPGCTEKVK